MKCSSCGRRESAILRGGTIFYSPEGKIYTCSQCRKPVDEANKALRDRARTRACDVCGTKGPANYGYTLDGNGDFKTFVCTDCMRAREKAERRLTIKEDRHVEVLREVVAVAKTRNDLVITDTSSDFLGPRVSIRIGAANAGRDWTGKPKELYLDLSVDGPQVVATRTVKYQVSEVFRVTVGPDCAEQVVNLVQVYLVSQK